MYLSIYLYLPGFYLSGTFPLYVYSLSQNGSLA